MKKIEEIDIKRALESLSGPDRRKSAAELLAETTKSAKRAALGDLLIRLRRGGWKWEYERDPRTETDSATEAAMYIVATSKVDWRFSVRFSMCVWDPEVSATFLFADDGPELSVRKVVGEDALGLLCSLVIEKALDPGTEEPS